MNFFQNKSTGDQEMAPVKNVTIKAPVNIAVIKYWGKSDEKQILALNDSISGTLSIDQLSACTSVMVSDKFTRDRFWLNGEEKNIESNSRMLRLLNEIRRLSLSENADLKMHICSINNFPTAAGLASSAAGYACLAYAIGQVLEVTDKKTLSIISRMGSGSACRSLYGGFVRWITSTESDESYAKQVVDEFYWPKMRIIVLVVNDAEKDTPSTAGMQLTVKTSTLFQHRITNVVPERVEEMVKAIKERNFHQFAELTMKDSNQFHACCQDSYPPIRYMNDISWSIVRIIHKLNEFYGTNRFAYTFDAGPNACIYLLENEVDEFLTLINHLYPNSQNDYNGEQAFKEVEINETGIQVENDLDYSVNIDNGYYRGLPYRCVPLKQNLLNLFSGKESIQTNLLKGIISTQIGRGPQIQLENESLLDTNGLPKEL